MPVSDYCIRAQRITLDLCEVGVRPDLTERGWGSCTLPTRADAELLATEAVKWDEECGQSED